MYLRKNNESLTIRDFDDKKIIIETINKNILKHINYQCVGLITDMNSLNKEIEVKSVICKEKETEITKIFKLICEFPNIKLCNLDGNIIAEGCFDTCKQNIKCKDLKNINEEVINENKLINKNCENKNEIKSTTQKKRGRKKRTI